MLALRSCAYSMCTCIYAVANITIDPTKETFLTSDGENHGLQTGPNFHGGGGP